MPNALNKVAIAGVGYSTVGRHLPIADDELVRQAVTAAMDDAGMTRSDIDGIGTMGGNAMAMGWLLGIMPLNYFFNSAAGPAFVEPAINSISAVASGLCHTCVAVRLIRQMPGQSDRLAAPAPTEPVGVGGDAQFSAPFGSGAAAASIAGFQMQAHMARYGTTEEQFAHNAVTQRYHATLNDDALFREPLTVEDYLSSRYISKPVRLFDCDYPCDSVSAVIFTTAERARDFKKKPVHVESFALSAIRDFDMSLLEDHTRELAGTLRRDALVEDGSGTPRRRCRRALRRFHDHHLRVARGSRILWSEARPDRSSPRATPDWVVRCRSTPTVEPATLVDATEPTSASRRRDRFAVSVEYGRFRTRRSQSGVTPSVVSLVQSCSPRRPRVSSGGQRRGSGRSTFQCRVALAIQLPSLRGSSENRVITRWPPWWSPYKMSITTWSRPSMRALTTGTSGSPSSR